jgi:predicted transcriptional regulator
MLSSITVKDYMAGNVVTFKPDTNILDAVRVLVDRRISGAPVIDKRGNIVGMLSEKDCMEVMLRAAYFEEAGGKVADYMSHGARTVNMEDSLVDVAKMFVKDAFRRYPVVRDNVLVGQISRGDVLRALEKLW